MKKINFVLLLFITFGSFLYASPNYKNVNGTILQESTIDNYRITIRKCEISTICGEFLNENMKIVYENYDYKDIVGKLIDNEKIQISQFCRIKDLTNENDWKNGEIWLKIKSSTLSGLTTTLNSLPACIAKVLSTPSISFPKCSSSSSLLT